MDKSIPTTVISPKVIEPPGKTFGPRSGRASAPRDNTSPGDDRRTAEYLASPVAADAYDIENDAVFENIVNQVSFKAWLSARYLDDNISAINDQKLSDLAFPSGTTWEKTTPELMKQKMIEANDELKVRDFSEKPVNLLHMLDRGEEGTGFNYDEIECFYKALAKSIAAERTPDVYPLN